MAATTENQETRLLTVNEAAKRCRVSKPHVYRLVASGEIPAVRVGAGAGPIRIDAGELEAWLYAEPGDAA